MADIPEELKLPLSLAGLPTTIKDLEDYLKDESNLKKFEEILNKVPAGTEIPAEITNIINNAKANHSENSSGDTSADIGAPELSTNNKANIKKIFQDIEKSIYNTVIMDKTDVKNNLDNKFLFKLTPTSGKNKRPDIHNPYFYHETQNQSDIPIFDTTAFWEPFIKQMFYPPGESSNTMDDFFLDIIDRVVQKINLSIKDQPYRIIYYKNNEIPSNLVEHFQDNKNNIAIKYIPNEEDAKKILEEKLKQDVKDI